MLTFHLCDVSADQPKISVMSDGRPVSLKTTGVVVQFLNESAIMLAEIQKEADVSAKLEEKSAAKPEEKPAAKPAEKK